MTETTSAAPTVNRSPSPGPVVFAGEMRGGSLGRLWRGDEASETRKLTA